ncbi:MAG: hypothetical protein LDL53_08350 [Candidatus Hydrogenedens sp.]|nr:hypothetical protein [Candidatus Hydrogenedens sp.]
MKKYLSNILAFLFGCFLLACIFLTAELICRLFLFEHEKITIHEEPSILIPDSKLGRKLRPDVNGYCKIQKGEKQVIYHYTIDEKGRRITPQEENSQKTKLALFFPCSYTFGVGVNDDETFPSYFAKLNPTIKVYNYGMPSGSPQQMYLKVSEPDFFTEVESLPCFLVYLFIPHHLDRVSGKFNLIGSWGRRLPCVVLEKDELSYKGLFMEVYPMQYLLSRLINSSVLMKKIFFISQHDMKLEYKDEDIILFVKILEKTKDILSTYFPELHFVFLFNPGSSNAIPLLRNYLSDLDKFIVIDFSVDEDKSKIINSLIEKNEYLGIDGHPTPKTNQIMAEWLTQDLKLKGLIP